MNRAILVLGLPGLILLAACTTESPLEPPTEPAGTPPTAPWMPRDSDLAFFSNRDGNGEIYLLPAGRPAEEAEWVNLTNHPEGDNWPVWSPDGSKIAFQSRRGGSLDIWVMNADGSEPLQLTSHLEPDYLPAWTPDGQWITFTSWRVEATLGDTERAPHIYIMKADGSEKRRLVAEALGTSSGASWAPDGERFVLSRRVRQEGADLFLADREGRAIARLTDDDRYHGAGDFSPDGSKIAGYVDDGSGGRLFVVNADGTDFRVLPVNAPPGAHQWTPHWSPDGRWLLYTGTAGEDGTSQEDLDLFAVAVDTPDSPDGPDAPLEPVRLITGTGREAEGSWRPGSWEARAVPP